MVAKTNKKQKTLAYTITYLGLLVSLFTKKKTKAHIYKTHLDLLYVYDTLKRYCLTGAINSRICLHSVFCTVDLIVV